MEEKSAEKKKEPSRDELKKAVQNIFKDLHISTEEYYRRRAEGEKARIKEIMNETDPERIIKLASIHESSASRENCYGTDVVGYEEKKAAMKNPNSPTIFMLYLYHYPEPERRHFGMDDRMGPPQYHAAAYVNDEVREAAKKALIAREWKLTEWDRARLSKAEAVFYERQLEKDMTKETLVNSIDRKTELGKMSAELIGFLKKGKRGE